MTCNCSTLNPWRRLAECPEEPSIFLSAFGRAAKTGMTQSQIATRSVTAHEERTGVSLGSIPGISDKAAKLTAQRQDQRRLVRQAKKGAA